MDKLATGGRRKTRVRRQTLLTLKGPNKLTILLDNACLAIWKSTAANSPKSFEEVWQWRKIWWPKLDEAFYDGFSADFAYQATIITQAQFDALNLLNGPHAYAIYKMMVERARK